MPKDRAPRLSQLSHRRIGALIRTAVQMTMADHPEFDRPSRIHDFANSVSKRALGMMRRELEQEASLSAKDRRRSGA